MKNNATPDPVGLDRIIPRLLVVAAAVAAVFAYDAQAQTAKPDTAVATPAATGATKVAAAKADNKKADDKKAAASRSASAMRNATPSCTGDFAAPVNVSLPAGKSAMLDLQRLKLPQPAWLRIVGNPDIVQVEPFTSQAARSTYFLFGKKIGATNLMFQDKEGHCAMVEVAVGVDTAAVLARLHQVLPGERDIKLSAAGDSMILSGTVSSALAVEQATSIANAFLRKGDSKGNDVVNMLTVGAPQQVMLEVKVAEISKTLLDKLGVNVSQSLHRGDWSASLLSNFLSGGNGTLGFVKNSNGDLVKIDAEKSDGLVKILAEPSVMAVSGQEGSFLAGGRIFIPVQSSNANGNTVTLEEREFGVGVRFTPTVLDGGRINLKVAPEVSELSREGAGLSTNTGATAVLPLFTTRRAATTVQLVDGQSFAIGGLIKNNVTENMKAFPFLGEIPVLGALFRSSEFQNERTELVFVITPRLVKPLPSDYVLPTDGFVPPSRSEFFFGGKLEGSGTAKPAAPAGAAPAAPSSGNSGNSNNTGFELN